ncbi:MAG: hypothetical protein JXA77_13550 [Bacteroidales bacterium]|nr:hypothetical protein [Bacteroidales bacterium]
MRTFTVTKDQFGFCFKQEPGKTWQRFPNGVTTSRQMENFFTEGGRLDKPQIIFSGQKEGSSKLYQVKRNGNKVVATVDFQKKLPFEQEQFMSVREQISFLQARASRETDQGASTITSEKELLAHYLENAEPETRKALEKRIAESITSERIKQLCQDHARQYHQMDAIIEFQG